jgi:hypothetical protein
MVEVGLGAVERDCSNDAVDPTLNQQPPPRRKVGRAPEARQRGNCGGPSRQQPRPILQGLDVPALDAAGKRRREADVGVLSGRSNSRGDCGSEGDEQDGRFSFHSITSP